MATKKKKATKKKSTSKKKPAKKVKRKVYVGISRDHSGSMGSISRAAMSDYNDLIKGILDSSKKEKVDTIVSVVEAGRMDYRSNQTIVRDDILNSNIDMLRPLTDYPCEGMTPLFDSVGRLIEIMESVPDAKNANTSFIIAVVTDGYENASEKWRRSLPEKLKTLMSTDRWTFTFRVPNGHKGHMMQIGIPEGNILEWEQTTQGMQQSSIQTKQAFSSYFGGVSKGLMRSTKSFYQIDMKATTKEVKKNLVDVSNEVSIWTVNDTEAIRPFCERMLGNQPMLKGAGFYQLVKKEKAVQDYKLIAIRDRVNGAIYSGPEARDMLGLPHDETVKVRPGDHKKWEIFIQSTSVNRVLPQGSKLLYWPNVGKYYKKTG